MPSANCGIWRGTNMTSASEHGRATPKRTCMNRSSRSVAVATPARPDTNGAVRAMDARSEATGRITTLRVGPWTKTQGSPACGASRPPSQT